MRNPSLRSPLVASALLAVAVLAPPVPAQITGGGFEARLRASDGAAGDLFGQDVSAAGGLVVVGAPGEVGGGAVYVFERTGVTWTETAKLTASSGCPEDEFGSSVATDGVRVVVGAPGHLRNDVHAGAVFVFGFDGTSWVEESLLLPVGGVPWGAFFGRHVDIDGSLVVGVGTLMNGVDGLFVFQEGVGAWNHLENVSPTSELPGGWSSINGVGILGPWLVSGAPFDFDPQFQSSGTASLQQFQGSGYVEQAQFFGAPGESFGWSVAIDHDHLVVGNLVDQHPTNGGTGSVWVYERDGSGWATEPAVLFASDAVPKDQLGFAVAVDGSRVAASARWDDGAAPNAGSVYVFETDAQGVWQERFELTSPFATPQQEYGHSLALDDDRLFVGVFDEAGPGGEANFGAVHVVRLLEEPGHALCLGDGTGAACPCGNEASGPDRGCAHSGGTGIRIRGTGSRSVTADDLALVAEDCPLGNSGIFYVGRDGLAPGVAVYDGLQCAGGDVRRFRGLAQSAGTVTDTGFVAQDPSGTYFGAGESYVFQYFSRDVASGASPCGQDANFSPGYAITMAP